MSSINGALIQLASIGIEDEEYSSLKPGKSIFKPNVSKKTIYSKQTCSYYSEGNNNWCSKLNFKIDRDGDLLSNCYLAIKLPEISIDSIKTKLENDGENPKDYYLSWVEYLGNTIIKNIKFKLDGDTKIEQSGEFTQIMTDLYDDDWNKLCLIGMDETLIKPQYTIYTNYIYVPLKFWFCQSIENALPLIALKYQTIEIEIELRDFNDCYQILKKIDKEHFVQMRDKYNLPKRNIINCRLDCNMIFVPPEERKELAEKDHHILITQTQEIKQNLSQGKNINISSLKHTVKESFFYIQNDNILNLPDPFNFSSKSKYIPLKIYQNPDFTVEKWDEFNKLHFLLEARFYINDAPREDWKDYKYYYYLQNYENYRNKLEHYVYLYAFNGKPTDPNPHGGLNFTRINEAYLQIKLNKDTFKRMKEIGYEDKELTDNNFNLHFFVVNYNYFDIKNGLGSIKYQY